MFKLKDIAEIQTGPFGSQLKNEQYITGGTPVVTVEHIQDFKIIDFDYPSVTAEDKQRLSKYLLKQGDIIFTRVGSVDLSAYVKPHQDGWMFSSRMLRVRPDRQQVDSRFLSYYFQQSKFREHILNISVGATMPSINTEILKSVEVICPPLKEQINISNVLNSLDDKIDLLYRQNHTLESLVETLFNGKLAVNKEKWKLASFGELIETTIGGEWGKEFMEGDFVRQVCCMRGTDIADLQVGLSERIPVRFVKEKKYENIQPKDGDLILEISGGTDDQSTGRAIYIDESNRKLFPYPIIFSNFCRLLRPKKKEYSYFIYLYLQYLYKQNEFFNLENGSSGIKNLDYKYLLFDLEYLFPRQEKEIVEINSHVAPYFAGINRNKHQIRTLTQLRDTLLPKLMSGEARVKTT